MVDGTRLFRGWQRTVLGAVVAIGVAVPAAAQDVVTRITDVAPGDDDGLLDLDAAVLGGFLYFVTSPGAGTDLYRYDGVNPPAPVPGADAADPREVVAWNGKLYFQGGDDDRELWEYDPADDSIGEVVEIRTTGNGLPQRFAATPDRLCFGGFSDSSGFEYFCWSGSGPATLYDLEPGATASFPDQLVAHGDRIAFVGRDAGEDVVYVQEAGSAPEVVEADVLQPYETPCCIGFAQGQLFFSAADATDGTARLYRYDGVSPAERVSETFEFDGVVSVLRDRVLAAGQDPSIGVNQTELFRLTASGLTRIAPGSTIELPSDAIEHAGALFTLGWDGTNLLYRYCGAGAVTIPVLASGGEVASPEDGRMISFAGRLFFAAESSVAGVELWALDSAHRHCDGFETGDASAWSATVP